MKNRSDLAGKKYGRLTVISVHKPGKGGRHVIWECLCDCGNTTYLPSSSIKGNHTKSCGCLTKELLSKRTKKYNRYNILGSYGIGYADDDSEFYFDLEDYTKIKDIKWQIDDGYVVGKMIHTYEKVRMHRLVMGVHGIKSGIIDHINRHRRDNRKENLRFVTHSQNMLNREPKDHVVGVYQRGPSWRIQFLGKAIGTFETYELAVIKRLMLEKEIYGDEFSPNKRFFDEYGI